MSQTSQLKNAILEKALNSKSVLSRSMKNQINADQNYIESLMEEMAVNTPLYITLDRGFKYGLVVRIPAEYKQEAKEFLNLGGYALA